MTISSILTYGVEHALLGGQPLPVDVRESITAASYEASLRPGDAPSRSR